MADHIPDPGQHRPHFYAHYANRVRGEQPPEQVGSQGHEEEPPVGVRSDDQFQQERST